MLRWRILEGSIIELGGKLAPDFTLVIGGADERPLALEDAASLRGLPWGEPLEQNFGKQLVTRAK